MDLVNPFESVSKADTWPPQGATILRALLPTGKHVGHGLDLHHTRNKGGGGGKRAGLEHYRGSVKGLRPGPFGKSVAQGLKMTGNYKPSRVPKAAPTPFRVRVARGKQGSINFGDASAKGRRVT